MVGMLVSMSLMWSRPATIDKLMVGKQRMYSMPHYDLF